MKAKIIITVLILSITSLFFLKENKVELTGKIHDYTGVGIMFSKLEIYSGTELVQTTFSDMEGNFALLDLIPGVYKLVIKTPGFKEKVEMVVLNEEYQNIRNIKIDGNVITLPPAIIMREI